jgi:hypothetical protein
MTRDTPRTAKRPAKAATSPPGKSPNCSQPRSGQRSSRCANLTEPAHAARVVPHSAHAQAAPKSNMRESSPDRYRGDIGSIGRLNAPWRQPTLITERHPVSDSTSRPTLGGAARGLICRELGSYLLVRCAFGCPPTHCGAGWSPSLRAAASGSSPPGGLQWLRWLSLLPEMAGSGARRVAGSGDPVSDAGDGLDDVGVVEFAAEPADGDLDGFGERVGVFVPCLG